MVYTNFPSGVTSLGVPVIGSGQLPITSGTYWFVSSVVGSNGNPGNEADLPFATLQTAINASSSGDIITVMPGHAETVSVASGITTVGKPGITIVGMGEGATRPTFTFSATAATFAIASANVEISNIVATTSIDQIVSPFVISAADCTFGISGAPVEWHDAANNKEALRAVLTTSGAVRLNVYMNYFGFTNGTHGVNAIRLVGVATATINIDYYGVCTTAVVEFFTTACTNVNVFGYMYVSGVTNFTKDIVDTVTGSTWFANIFDGAFGGLVSGGSASALAAAQPAGTIATINTNTTAINNNVEKSAVTSAAVITNGLALFTVTGPVEIMAIGSICATANSATASTLQYSSSGTLGATTQTISGATTSLASATAGTTVLGILTALTTAPTINANAAGLISTGPSTIMVPAGTITAVVGVGSTTGTWQHFIRYKPLAPGAAVTNAF